MADTFLTSADTTLNPMLALAERVEEVAAKGHGDLILQAFYAIHGDPIAAHVMPIEQRAAWIKAEGVKAAFAKIGYPAW